MKIWSWLLALGVMAAIPQSAGAAEDDLTIREVKTDAFPEVEVIVATERTAALEAFDLQVFEDGVAVDAVTVAGLDTSGQRVEAVLALDVSGSMEGEPLAAAVAAARRFVRSVDPGVRVGLLTFSHEVRVIQEPTTDHASILEGLAGLTASGETAIYDAVAEAASMFTGDAQRNVILLSDGGDTASSATLHRAAVAATDAGAAVFSIGWRTEETDIAALRQLAKRTDGRYATAGSADVEAIYAGLAAELSNQHLVSYRSDSSGGREASITVSGPRGTDTVLVLFPEVVVPTPKSGSPSVQQPYRPPLLQGVLGMAISVGLVFLAALVLLAAVLDIPASRRRRRLLERRIGASGWQPNRSEEDDTKTWIPEQIADAAQRVAESAGFAGRLDRRLERAGVSLRPGEYMAIVIMAPLAGGIGGGILFQSILGGLLFALLGALIPIVYLSVIMRRRLRRLHDQVVDVLMIIASSLRAGHSFLQALDMVSKEISEPAAGEFSRALSEIRLGRPIDEALGAMAERIGSEDFDWAMMAVNIQREVGGNLAEVLDTVGETLRDREAVRRQVKVLAAEGKLSARILTVLPFLIALYVAKVNPGYINLLFSTRLGLMMLAAGGFLMVLGILVMRKMVRIDV